MQDFLPLHSAPPHQSTCHLLLPHPQQIEPWTAHKYRNQENKLYDYLFMDQEARTWAFTCSINLMYVVRDNTTSSYIPTIDFGSSTNNKNRTTGQKKELPWQNIMSIGFQFPFHFRFANREEANNTDTICIRSFPLMPFRVTHAGYL